MRGPDFWLGQVAPGPHYPESQVESRDFHLCLTAKSPPRRCWWRPCVDLRLSPHIHTAPAPARACHRQPATTEILRPRVSYENRKRTAETPYLFLKYFGQGGAVRQFNEPHHVGHCPLQRVALQNQSPLLLLLYFLQREGSSRSFHQRMVSRVLSKALRA